MLLWQRSIIFLFPWNVMDICGFWMSLQASATYNKKKKKSQGKQSEWKSFVGTVCVCDTYCIKWCLTCLPYFPEWNFCCSPSLIPQGSTLLVTDKEFSKGAKRILTHWYPLEVWKSSRKQMFYTQRTPPNALPPCLLWIVCFTFHQKVSLKPAYF